MDTPYPTQLLQSQVIHYHCHHGNIAIPMPDYLTQRCRENKLSSYPYIKAHTYTLVC